MSLTVRPSPLQVEATARRGAALVAGSLTLAVLSLLLPSALAFDPWAWLVWGRDTLRLALDTTPGPSWKPLPVLFTAPFSLLGGAAPALWLVVARAGGLLALAGAWTLASRLGGRWAGAAAAAAMALSSWWAYNCALGNSEGLLAAAVLWAAVAHLSRRPRGALALLTAAALLRPEAWPFLLAYGVWLWRARPGERRAVAIAAALVPLLWVGPDVIGAGGALAGSGNARGTASRGSAQLASVPALAVLWDAVTLLTIPALIAAVPALVGARARGLPPGARPRNGASVARWLAAAAAAWVLLVAAMTTAGYAGNPRYLVAAAALGCVLAGVGAVRLARAAPAAGAVVLAGAVLAFTAPGLRDRAREVGERHDRAAAFDGLVAAAGGRDALLRCGPVRTSLSARSFVAWRLDLPMRGLGSRPAPPAALIRMQWFFGGGLEPRVRPGYDVLASAPGWQVVAVGCRE